MIKGIVTDSITGEPLPYVAVILNGTTIGATTDLDGAFTLSLHLRYVLYRSLIWVYGERIEIRSGIKRNI